jgi:hypothetical protein
MFGLNGYSVGFRQDNGSIEEVTVVWDENYRSALLQAKTTAIKVGDPVDRIVLRHIMDPNEIIEAMNDVIVFLSEENEELEAELAEYDDLDDEFLDEEDVDDLDIEIWKPCSKCGVIKRSEHFYPQKGGKYGRRADCIECKRESSRNNTVNHKVS